MSDTPQKEPIVIHLGKKSRKQIKKYKKGIGSMFMEVQQIIARTNAQTPAEDEVVPMVVLHRNKKRKKKKKKYKM